MSEGSAIKEATKRLQDALDALESAAERRTESDRDTAALTEQVHLFEFDRSRLAAELDGTAARARALETANREVASRLDEAIGGIRAVLDVHEPSDSHDA